MTVYASAGPSTPGGDAVFAVEEPLPEHVDDDASLAEHVRENADRLEKISPRTDLVNHSPTGMSWGYGGSGAAQAALAILAHACSEETALREYQSFKWDAIAAADGGEPLVVTDDEILESLGDGAVPEGFADGC